LNSKLELEVHVTSVSHGEVANLLRGYVVAGNEKYRFTAIAYGRIGGQNVSPKVGKATAGRLRKKEINVEEFLDTLQRKLVEGDVTLESPPRPEFTL
jgi:hypothetical protein